MPVENDSGIKAEVVKCKGSFTDFYYGLAIKKDGYFCGVLRMSACQYSQLARDLGCIDEETGEGLNPQIKDLFDEIAGTINASGGI